jgi:hypothetical protein
MCPSDQHLQQAPLLPRGLLLEQLARMAGQPQGVNGLIQRRSIGLLDVLDPAAKTELLPPPGRRVPVIRLLADAAIQFIHVHGLDPLVQTLDRSFQALDVLRPRRLCGSIRLQHRLAEPIPRSVGNGRRRGGGRGV